MKAIHQTYTIHSSVKKVWDALVNPKTIEKWGAGFAKMDDKVGTEFKLWGGDIYGKNVEVVKNKKLVQEWFGGVWDKPSQVKFELTSKGNSTVVALTQTGVPEKDVEDIAGGWKEYYLGPLKSLLES
ncbi:MAG: SRPBCC domain-containing protein [Candidatus Levyibacteriota bacterium]